jgi:glycosyltransferase involved in cell wall biosynthesis
MSEGVVCFVIPTMCAGGMQRVMSELAGYFCIKPGLKVHLVMYGKDPEIFYQLPPEIYLHKNTYKYEEHLRFWFAIKAMLYLRSEIKMIDPDSVLSFGEYWNSLVLLALFGLPYSVYISDRCSPAKEFDFVHSLIRRFIYPKAKGIISQTLQAKQIYKVQFRHDNVTVIGNPIRQIESLDTQSENIVISVGRLITSKNHDKLIEIFCSINKPGWRLLIVGGDALKQDNLTRLRKLVSDLHAESKVHITGYVNNTEELLGKSKIFAFTSTSEGFPNVIGEAMSAGLPVVTFDCVAGPSDMINNEYNGFLVPVNNYESFKEKLDQLMSDESLRTLFGSRAKKSIEDFSTEMIGDKYFDFILKT